MHARNRFRSVAAALAALCAAAISCKHNQEPPPAAVAAEPTAPSAAVETGPDDQGAMPHHVDPTNGLAVGSHGGVASAEANASEVGIEILKKGGNAVDAAVAVGFALGVTHPTAGNIGGGGFMVIHLPDGTNTTIDYREMAPGRATADMYLDASGKPTDESRVGPRAAGIPGVVAGLAYAHDKYGKLPWKEVVAPAVALARNGFTLDSFHADDLAWGVKRMVAYQKKIPADQKALAEGVATSLATFRKPDGTAYQAGDLFKQPDLAKTLELIAEKGPSAFYRGPLAAEMAREVTAMGGLWTRTDLANYEAVERAPITFDYNGYQVVTMPPPSAGGVVLRQILAASDILGLPEMPWDSVDRIHLYVESLRRIYADRNLLMGDPDFVDIPLKTILDVGYLKKRLADIEKDRATPSSKVGAGVELQEKTQTTHFSVVDENRMAVANTYTLNGGFGSKVMIPGTGVIMNNEMDDFTAKPGAPNMFGLVQGPQNAIAPGKRMLSSMTPTILLENGKLRAVVGSPGGPTITTTVAQILMQMIDHDRPLEAAVSATRIHHQWLPDKIWHEPTLSPTTMKQLRDRGHQLGERGHIGDANCIEIKGGKVRAVADVARDGGAAFAY